MVQCHEVDKLRRIFIIGRTDVGDDHLRHVLHLLMVIPERFKQLHILGGKRRFHTVDHVVAVITAFTANIHCGKAIQGHIGGLLHRGIDSHKSAHIFTGNIGFEGSFAPDPISTFSGNSPPSHFIAQLDFKFRSIQAGFPAEPWNIKFPPLLFSLFPDKGRGGEYKSEFVYLLQLAFQLFVCVHGKAGGRDGNLTAALYSLFQIIPDDICDIVKYFHHKLSLSGC